MGRKMKKQKKTQAMNEKNKVERRRINGLLYICVCVCDLIL